LNKRARCVGGGRNKRDAKRAAASYLIDQLVNNEHFDEMCQRANNGDKTAKKLSRRRKRVQNESKENGKATKGFHVVSLKKVNTKNSR
jgi:hypothetical protein